MVVTSLAPCFVEMYNQSFISVEYDCNESKNHLLLLSMSARDVEDESYRSHCDVDMSHFENNLYMIKII